MSRTPIELDGVTPAAPTDFHPPRARHRAATLFSPLRSSSTPASLLFAAGSTRRDRENLLLSPISSPPPYFFSVSSFDRGPFVQINFYSKFFPSMRLQANLLTTILIVKSQRFDLGRRGTTLSPSLSLSPRLNCIDSAEKRAIQRERSLDSRYRLSV